MWGGVAIKVPPAGLPLTVADLRRNERLETPEDAQGLADEDATLTECLAAAVASIEGPKGIGVALMTQTWTLSLDRFQAEIALPGWPVKAISEIRYVAADGAAAVLGPADYRLAAGYDPARLVPARGLAWPAVTVGPSAVEVDYVLGEATAAAVDQGLLRAVSMLAGHFFEHREATTDGPEITPVPMGVDRILARFRRGPGG